MEYEIYNFFYYQNSSLLGYNCHIDFKNMRLFQIIDVSTHNEYELSRVSTRSNYKEKNSSLKVFMTDWQWFKKHIEPKFEPFEPLNEIDRNWLESGYDDFIKRNKRKHVYENNFEINFDLMKMTDRSARLNFYLCRRPLFR